MSIETLANGSGVAQLPLPLDDPDAPGEPEAPDELELGASPGGSHPPFTHVPPPSTTNGSGVVQPPAPDAPPEVPDDVPPDVDPDDPDDPDELELGASPGGSHPPFTHVPPPSTTNGSGDVQAARDTGGVVAMR